MFAQHSHPYLLQVAALWFSFLPALAVMLLIAGAQLETLRRRGIIHLYERPVDFIRLLRHAGGLEWRFSRNPSAHRGEPHG